MRTGREPNLQNAAILKSKSKMGATKMAMKIPSALGGHDFLKELLSTSGRVRRHWHRSTMERCA
jgi:hypothetical protein